MKVLITGGNGMVARAAALHCESIGDEVLSVARQDLDIADASAVENFIAAERPDTIINCAAYTNVDGAETEIEESFAANVTGVENLAHAARKNDCGFVTISTDFVFDGTKGNFYTQRDNANPLGIYAKHKYEGEVAAREAYARSIIIRTGWIFGHGGTNFLSKMPELLRGANARKVTAIADSYGTPTFAEDLVKRLRELAELDLPAIYHVTNSGSGTTYADFARLVAEDEMLVENVSAKDLQRPAPRPLDSRLRCLFSEKFGLAPLPDWQDAVRRFVVQASKI